MAITGRAFALEAGAVHREELALPFRRFGAIVYAALAQRDDRPIGTLVLANAPGGRPFDDEDARLATAFAHQAGLALALTEARAAEDRLAVYADRERIARDLHDLTIQRIFAAGLSLQTLSRRLHTPGPDLPAAAARLDGVIDELDAAIAEIRTTIFDLQLTADQEATSTRARVLREASRAARVLGFEPSVRFAGPLDSLVGGDTGAHLVAAVRETLANAAKHAGATRVEVVVTVENGTCHDADPRRRRRRRSADAALAAEPAHRPAGAVQPRRARPGTRRQFSRRSRRRRQGNPGDVAGPVVATPEPATTHQTTWMVAIIPMSSCSRLWQ